MGGLLNNTTAFQALPRLVQLNIEMDLKAKARLRSLILTSSNPLPAAPLRSEGWRCILNDVKITLDPSKQIYKAIMDKQLQSYLHERNILPSMAFSQVNWDAINSATSHFPPLYKLLMSKHVSGFLSVGKMMKHWQFWNHKNAPVPNTSRKTKHTYSLALTNPALTNGIHLCKD
jgi:hypothetical protein